MRNLLSRSFLAILALLVIATPSLGQQGIAVIIVRDGMVCVNP